MPPRCPGRAGGWLLLFILFSCLLLVRCVRPSPEDLASLYKDAVAAQRRGDYEEALRLAERGQSKAAENSERYWKFRLLQPEIRMSRNELERVRRDLADPVPHTAPRSAVFEARRLMVLGWSYHNAGDLSRARELLNQALAGSPGEKDLESQILVLLGSCSFTAGDLAGAEQTERKALASAEAANDRFLMASPLGMIGLIRLTQGRYEEALYWFDRVKALAEETQSKSLLAITLENIGWCWFRLGETEKAGSYFDQARPLFMKMGKYQNLHKSLGNRGSAWLAMGDLPKAIDYFQQALHVAEQSKDQLYVPVWLVQLAMAHLETGHPGLARPYLERARPMRVADDDRRTRAWLGILEGQLAELEGSHERAAAAYQRVAYAPSFEPTVVFEARARLARLADRSGDEAGANRQYLSLLNSLDKWRGDLSKPEVRMSWLSSLIRFHKEYVRFLWRHGRKMEALEAAEASRGRVLAERLGNSKRGPQARARQLQEQSKRTGCTLASYWLGPEESYVWVITAASIEPSVLPAQKQIAADVAAVRRQIESLRDPTLHPAIARLSGNLLTPLGDHARGCVMISPDQDLYSLNFDTLLLDGRYWVEQADVRIAPMLASLPRHGTAQDGVLLFGNPVTPPQSGLPPLANAGAEIKNIQALYPEAQAVTGADATVQKFFDASPDRFGLIHVSAHAVANRESPLDSAVILTQAEDRYQLKAREIAGLELRANLVTLSACHSAGTRSYAGEGTVGLAWAFLNAGARNVVAGLWAIDDQSSAQLMRSMYSSLRSGATPGQALRAAKLSFVTSPGPLKKPFYWAAWQLYALN